jgi:hypothetical protein
VERLATAKYAGHSYVAYQKSVDIFCCRPLLPLRIFFHLLLIKMRFFSTEINGNYSKNAGLSDVISVAII